MAVKPIYRNVCCAARGNELDVRFELAAPLAGACIGWQLFDPDTNVFVCEGSWIPAERENCIAIELPAADAAYRVYVSPVAPGTGWAYTAGHPFLLIDAGVADGRAQVRASRVVTTGTLRRESFLRAIPRAFTYPLRSIARNRALIRSMVKRDILARYRGSFGDVFWTILNPLLLMLTYWFVFGVVLRARFGEDTSSSGFVLYFLAGMLPWLAFSEAAGRSPASIVEHRNFVKKLVFPVETLPVNYAVSGIVTELFALGVFVVLLLALRGGIPATALWLPVLLVPQFLFTLGLCWLLAALGVFMRDLAQITGFVLTLWFFVTPICYPESSLPPALMPLLTKNPLFVLVRAYRDVLLQGHAPAAGPLAALFLLAAAVFITGFAFFHKLRRSFADVI